MAEEALFDIVLEAGGDDMNADGDEYEITTSFEGFEPVRQALEKANVKPSSAELSKIADNPVAVDAENAAKILRLMEALDEADDTQHVYSNFDISDEIMEKLGKE
jgi:transcriptional/translational regulatory protein YebC/TACO1